MGIFEATLKEELNKLLVQSSICTSNTIYPTATCHSHHVLTPIAPRHKNYAIFGTVHKYYIPFPTYVRAIQPYVFQFISTAFASTQDRSKYSKTISPSNSLLNEGGGLDIPSRKFHSEISLPLLARCYIATAVFAKCIFQHKNFQV